MKPDLLRSERVEEWRSHHPREWWAFQKLNQGDKLRERVLAAILGRRTDRDEALDDLERFAAALENRQRAEREGVVREPPSLGQRRSFPVRVLGMVRRRTEDGRVSYRVDFATPYGWSGMFDTTKPEVVERVAKLRDPRKPVTLVGEIVRRPYEFLVVLGARVRIV